MPKGRRTKEVEFFRYLAQLLGYDSYGDYTRFAKRIGKSVSDTHAYYNGRKSPAKRAMRSILQHAFEWNVTPIVEVGQVDIRPLTMRPGVYCLYDSSGSVIYVGQATNLKQEVAQTLQRKMNFPVRLGPTLSKKAHPKYKAVATHLSAYEVSSPRMRHNLEALLLRTFPNQSHNNKMGNFR